MNKKKDSRKVSNRLDVDKVLFDHDAEQMVLGAIMLDGDCLPRIAEIFNPRVFNHPPNRYIAEAVMSLFSKGKPVDMLTVTQEVNSVGLLQQTGGAFYISSCTNRIASGVNTETHYRSLQQYYLEREMIRIDSETNNRIYSYGNDVFETYDWKMKELESLLNSVHAKKAASVYELHQKAVKEMRDIQETGRIPGITSGYRHIDNISAGWQKSDSILVAARPGMGKTAFVVGNAFNTAVMNSIPVAIFSLEMSGLQLIKRIISLNTEIESNKIRKHKLTKDELNFIEEQGELRIKNAPLCIDDTAAISIFEFRAKARRLVAEKGVQLIIVDYLQLMRGEGGNREQEISSISAAIKNTAKELDVPIIALSQLSRQVENRPDKKPQLSDLRESGSLEQDADIVMFLYRPEYYGLTEYELNGAIVSANELAIIITAKNRHGEVGETPLRFIPSQIKFENYDMSLIGSTITKQDVIQHQETMQKYLGAGDKNSTFVHKQPDQDFKQETLTNNESFLSEKGNVDNENH